MTSPAVVVIGEVVRLADRCSDSAHWLGTLDGWRQRPAGRDTMTEGLAGLKVDQLRGFRIG